MRELTTPQYIVDALDEYQIKPAMAPLTNIEVFAVAGSGKTRLMTYRVANLIENGIDEKEIMLLTFTNQAAEEMTERIQHLLGKERVAIESGTFHSVGNTLLKRYDVVRHQILDDNEAKDLFKISYNKYKDDLQTEFKSHKALFGMISTSVNHNKKFNEMYPDLPYSDYKCIKNIVEDYKKAKREIPARDFDDLMLDLVTLLEKNEKAFEEITSRYKYIFVDEYQDVNYHQYKTLKLLNQNDNLFVVGDVAQAIYAFRGSDKTYMENFEKEYENVLKYSLYKNYRSVSDILELAENSIANNGYDNEIKLISFKGASEDLRAVGLFEFDRLWEEGNFIADTIENHIDESKYNETAILCRTNFGIRMIEPYLFERKIPYKVIGGLEFFQRAHIKDIVNMIKVVSNVNNPISFFSFAKMFKGIGDRKAEYIYNELVDSFNSDIENMLKNYEFKNENERKVVDFIKELSEFRAQCRDVVELINYFMDNFYEEYMSDKYEKLDLKLREGDIILLNSISKGKTIDMFLDEITLNNDLLNEEDDDENKVKLMTIHKAKGKEWDNVFLPAMTLGNLPMKVKDEDYINNTEDVKNERNLYYVAVTRAREKLFISYAQEPFFSYGGKKASKSPFIDESFDY